MSALVLLVTTWISRISYRIRYVGPSLATSLEPIDLRRQVAISSLFYRHYFGRCSSGPFPLLYSRGRFILYSNLLHDSSVAIPRCYKDVYVNSFFPGTVCLQYFVLAKCFPLTYDLNGFKSRVVGTICLWAFSNQLSYLVFIFFLFFFFITPYVKVAFQLYIESIPIKKL